MDIDGNIINIDLNGSNRGAGVNTTANLAWDFGDLHRFPWTTARAAHPEASFDLGFQQPVLYAGGDDGCHFHPDPHLACLRLGKLHYLDERGVGLGKKGKGNYGVPRCQVEGCEAVLVNAKEYHRRHKVCELHSKAPKVVVLGLEQRFCQQCSRFHVVSEFDEWKRSCRRRLAGHNERRRKTSSHSLPLDSSSFSINSSQEDNKLMGEKSGRAHSLLSSPEAWISPEDLSSRGSEALRELIAEHRAAALARQLLLDHHRDSNALALAAAFPRSTTTILHGHGHGHWDRFQQASAHVTLDLMHVASASPLPFGEPLPKGEGGQLQLWNSLHGNDQNLF